MSLDLDRITHPLRLAKGSHQRGSGKGCAMNVISYINGDTVITDFPDCSAVPLARLVQSINDRLAGDDDFLSPENSVLVLDLGWQTVGTADVADEVMWRWLAELLVDPEMGVVKFATPEGAQAIRDVAALCAREASGDRVGPGQWHAAQSAASVAAHAASSYCDLPLANSACGAAASIAFAAVGTCHAALENVLKSYPFSFVIANFLTVAERASTGISFARWAIQRWRQLQGLDTVGDFDPARVNQALEQMRQS